MFCMLFRVVYGTYGGERYVFIVCILLIGIVTECFLIVFIVLWYHYGDFMRVISMVFSDDYEFGLCLECVCGTHGVSECMYCRVMV